MSETTNTLTPAENKSKQAIEHVLTRIRDHSGIGWYMGFGTQSFDLLTEAYAELTGESLDEVVSNYEPLNASDPSGR